MHIFIFAFLLLSGCVSIGNPSAANHDIRQQVVIGQTTQEEAKALLGEPNGMTQKATSDGIEESWAYHYVTVESNALAYIPVVNLIAFASGNAIETEASAFTLVFSSEGIVKSVEYGHSNSHGVAEEKQNE